MVAAVAAALIGSPATASAAVDAPRIVAHFSLAAGQQPENLLVEPDGSVDLTFSFSRVLAHLDRQGRLTTVATVPAPPDGTVVPLIGSAFVGGIARTADGTLYVTYAAGDANLTGIWRIRPGGEPQRITAMPADGVPNGLVLADGYLYTTDSARATVWKSPISGGNPTAWITDPALAAPAGQFGVNGAKLHNGAIWVTNFAAETVVRIPFAACAAAGNPVIVASGVGHADDFDFTGTGDDALVTTNPDNTVVLVHGDGSHTTALTAADGLQNPTSLARHGNLVYVADAAYFSKADPNLLVARLER